MAFKKIAARACLVGARASFCLVFVLGLAACSSLPQPPARAEVYDFGPGLASTRAGETGGAERAAIVLASAADELTMTDSALYYRLAYANAQQLRPYALARWSQPPAELLTRALRDRLGRERAVLSAADVGLARAGDGAGAGEVLRVRLEEFSQVFDAPEASHALVRVRASRVSFADGEERLRGQRVFVVRRAAATPDAAGGARALAEAAAQVADELARWLAQP